MKLLLPKKIVLIGASTGGPKQIENIILALPELQDTTVIIAQHMIEGFIKSFANRLADKSDNLVSVVQDKQTFKSNYIYLCDGYVHLNILPSGLQFSKKISLSYNEN